MSEEILKPHTEEEVVFWKSQIENAEAIGDIEGVLIYKHILGRRAIQNVELGE